MAYAVAAADPSDAVPFAAATPGGGHGARWKWIAFAACIALATVYVSYYYRAPATITILQSTLADFRLEMLYEKQPVVLQERVADMASLHAAWFPRTRRLARSPAIAPPPPPSVRSPALLPRTKPIRFTTSRGSAWSSQCDVVQTWARSQVFR